MKKYRRYLPIIAVLLVALGTGLDRLGIDLATLSLGEAMSTAESLNRSAPSTQATGTSTAAIDRNDLPRWTTTEPNINQWHIFMGEINRSGKPVGYHARPNGIDPKRARVRSLRDGPNRVGVYTATIEIRDKQQWKQKFSTFFPDSLSREQVIDTVLNAYHNSPDPLAQPFEGPSGLGFRIQGYTSSRGGIQTAYPIYER